MNNPRLLIVDDESDMRWVIRGVFEDEGFEIAEAGNGAEALAVLEEFRPDVVLTDLMMPEMDGKEFLQRSVERDENLPVILISAVEDIEVAVRAMKDGAFDWMPKPFDRERLLVTARRAAEQHRLHREIESLKGQLESRSHTVSFGSSAPAQELGRTLELVSRQGAVAVMLFGESGTGKEVAAREIHRRGSSPDGPFVAVDCGALPEQLMESQLFGHKKGAFTGADRDRQGLFMMADNGTLFLDELGNLPLGLQAKLLRALQERTVVPVGGGTPVPFHARLISATNSNLIDAVDRGEFRLDLYHRVCEFAISLPPLRDRPEDIEHFASLFLGEANHDMGRHVESLSPDAVAALKAAAWPGNLRELRNVIRRAMVVCSGRELVAVDLHILESRADAPTTPLPNDASTAPLAVRIQKATDSLEAQIIQQALDATGGNKAAAARALQIDYTTLHRKLKKHGLLV
jgi:DNA-binding NtrC family response regulator